MSYDAADGRAAMTQTRVCTDSLPVYFSLM